jgi:hypothetical protein
MRGPKPKVCRYTEAEIRDSGLLSPERLLEVTAQVNARVMACRTSDGREVPDARIADLGKNGFAVFPRLTSDADSDYMRKLVLATVLTDEELKRINSACELARAAKVDRQRFARAAKFGAWEHGVVFAGEHYESVEALIRHLDEVGDGWPEYVWAAEPVPVIPHFSVGDTVGRFLLERGWDGIELTDLSGVQELQKAISQFIALNATVFSYQPDHTKAILLGAWRNRGVSPATTGADSGPA